MLRRCGLQYKLSDATHGYFLTFLNSNTCLRQLGQRDAKIFDTNDIHFDLMLKHSSIRLRHKTARSVYLNTCSTKFNSFKSCCITTITVTSADQKNKIGAIFFVITCRKNEYVPGKSTIFKSFIAYWMHLPRVQIFTWPIPCMLFQSGQIIKTVLFPC